jgi:RimJ/RimL family protein N-acetyltransferase
VQGIAIRAARPADAELIAGYQVALALETEDRALDARAVRAGVRGVFEDPARGRYLIAELDGRAVGSLLLTTEWSDWRAGTFWWIQSVFLEPSARGRGVFGALYRRVDDEARATPGVAGLRLYVEAENGHAQRVYASLGMERTGYRLFEVDFGRPAVAAERPHGEQPG